MTDPKVSEGMQTLITRAFVSTHCYECMCDGDKNPTLETRDRLALVFAVAALEARAEKAEAERDKWKRVAVAMEMKRRADLDYDRAHYSTTKEEMNKLFNAKESTLLHVAEAIAALGDEWTEAVK